MATFVEQLKLSERLALPHTFVKVAVMFLYHMMSMSFNSNTPSATIEAVTAELLILPGHSSFS